MHCTIHIRTTHPVPNNTLDLALKFIESAELIKKYLLLLKAQCPFYGGYALIQDLLTYINVNTTQGTACYPQLFVSGRSHVSDTLPISQ